MGLFGFGKKSKDGSSGKNVLKFLEEADKLYIRAYETRSIVILKDDFKRDCVIKLSRIIASDGAGKFFGNEKFRETIWSLLRGDELSELVYLKQVSYSKIKVAGSFSMSVSEDYKEEWTVVVEDGKFMVSNIELVKET